MTEFSEEMIEDAAQGVMNLNNDNAGTANIIGTQWAINASNTLNNLVSILTPNQNSQEGS